jgi:hypothetical protein
MRWRQAGDLMARITADHLVRHLEGLATRL